MVVSGLKIDDLLLSRGKGTVYTFTYCAHGPLILPQILATLFYLTVQYKTVYIPVAFIQYIFLSTSLCILVLYMFCWRACAAFIKNDVDAARIKLV